MTKVYKTGKVPTSGNQKWNMYCVVAPLMAIWYISDGAKMSKEAYILSDTYGKK